MQQRTRIQGRSKWGKFRGLSGIERVRLWRVMGGVLLGAGFAMSAQAQPAANTPTPGQILEQIQPQQAPARPQADDVTPQIKQRQPQQLPANQTLQLSRLVITGAEVFPVSRLHALVAGAEGKTLSLADVQQLAGRITQFYRQQGYLLTRAYIPAQTIKNGVVKIAVLEGSLEHIKVDNKADLGGFALAPLHGIDTGTPLTAASLERGLLLTADLPGVIIESVLTPGEAVGTSDLHVTVDQSQRISGVVSADNYGGEATGEVRTTGTLRIASPLGLGDALALTGLLSVDGMTYARARYELPVSPWGTRAGVSYAHLDYDLGGDFSALDAEGQADVAALWVDHPIIRRRQFSLYGELRYEHKKLQDRINAFGTDSWTQLDNITLGLRGNVRDDLLGGGITSAALRYTHGDADLDPTTRATDAVTAERQGDFNKWNMVLQRYQHLVGPVSLYLSYRGQYTSGNLPSAEKMSLGGAYGVRAYPQGAVSGDRAHLVTLELRYRLPASLPGQWQLTGFIDHGYAEINAEPWTNEDNTRSLTGAGVGLNVTVGDGWQVQMDVAWAVDDDEQINTDDHDQPRGWLRVAKYF